VVTGGDPILWGTVAFLLNYVPILCTALGVLIFLLAGLLTHDTLWQALLPAGLYFGFHLIEGETVTPMLLARRFNPESRSRHHLARLLVLAVGYSWRDRLYAHVGDY
jgi:predicted PurR-regulated permease PerM